LAVDDDFIAEISDFLVVQNIDGLVMAQFGFARHEQQAVDPAARMNESLARREGSPARLGGLAVENLTTVPSAPL
jgi:hypothetical protein